VDGMECPAPPPCCFGRWGNMMPTNDLWRALPRKSFAPRSVSRARAPTSWISARSISCSSLSEGEKRTFRCYHFEQLRREGDWSCLSEIKTMAARLRCDNRSRTHSNSVDTSLTLTRPRCQMLHTVALATLTLIGPRRRVKRKIR
jgi:hypothetical protein